jgi:hypothetical protein
MPYRVFKSPDGTIWRAWNVPGPQEGDGLALRDEMLRNGWLCFESDREKRRLVPVPDRWAERSEEQLWLYCRVAEPARPLEQTVNPDPSPSA